MSQADKQKTKGQQSRQKQLSRGTRGRTQREKAAPVHKAHKSPGKANSHNGNPGENRTRIKRTPSQRWDRDTEDPKKEQAHKATHPWESTEQPPRKLRSQGGTHNRQGRSERKQQEGCVRDEGPKLKKLENKNQEIKYTQGHRDPGNADKERESHGGKETPHRHLPNRHSEDTESGRKTKQKRPEKKETGITPSP